MTTGQAPAFAAVMLLTGIGVPVLAALNAGLGTRLGHPMAASVILFALALLIAVGQLAKTIRQLKAFEINLKPLCDTVIFGADLCQRGL